MQALMVESGALRALRSLAREALLVVRGEGSDRAAGAAAAGPIPAELARELADRGALLKKQAAEANAAAPLRHRQVIQQQALPTAEGLAEALQQYWALPEQVAAARWEACQAVATHRCAFLRCANLGLEGGPAAGEGGGSLRCAACRSVWYCGTTCSHADWRAGHTRVCKALAAGRQEERRQS